MERGIIGLFGPNSKHTSSYIQSVCDNQEIPQIELHFDPALQNNRFVVNLYPCAADISHLILHLITSYHWNKVIILFENDDSLLRIATLLELNTMYGVHFIFIQLDKDLSGSYRQVLSSIKKMEDKHIIVECSIEILEEVLIQAQQVGIMTEQYKFIITNLDLSSINLDRFQYAGTNITGIRMFDPQDDEISALHFEIMHILGLSEKEAAETKMRLSTALLIDGVTMFYDVIREILSRHRHIDVKSRDCENVQASWRYGLTIANKMKAKDFAGITGNIRFDFEGVRRYFGLELVELTMEGLKTIGHWDSSSQSLLIQRQRTLKLTQEEPDYYPFNRTFKIVIVLTAPYAMLKETTDQLLGNDRFEGFCVDVIGELSALLGFNYTFIVQDDGKNGNLNRTTNQWDGVIRKIVDATADLAITDLTITSERETAVDFTYPFMNLGISILYKQPEPVPPSLFMFLSPFSSGVWLMLGGAYIVVSIAIFIMGRLSPSEWTNPYPCVEEPEYYVNQFTIRNSLWFTIGGLLQQGSELAPVSISIRTVSGFWWFFVLIMCNSYTANLAAFLTVKTVVTPFKNIDELAKQTNIKIGAKHGGATENFFRDSNTSSHKIIYQHLKTHPEEMTAENDEGVTLAETDNYAFLMESTSIEYAVQRHCTLSQVGGLLDDKGYGIAMKKGSRYHGELSVAVIRLQETGVLSRLKIKWWKEKRGGSTCSVKSSESEAQALDLQNVGGVFLVLFVGSILGIFGSFLETAASIYWKSKRTNESFLHHLKKELNFFVQFKKNIKEQTPLDEELN